MSLDTLTWIARRYWTREASRRARVDHRDAATFDWIRGAEHAVAFHIFEEQDDYFVSVSLPTHEVAAALWPPPSLEVEDNSQLRDPARLGAQPWQCLGCGDLFPAHDGVSPGSRYCCVACLPERRRKQIEAQRREGPLVAEMAGRLTPLQRDARAFARAARDREYDERARLEMERTSDT